MVERKGAGVTERFGLRAADVELIREVFRRHPEIQKVKVFGSRAAGRFDDRSDVDLALWGQVPPDLAARIFSELDELPLPYTLDILVYEIIEHEPLKRCIDETGRVLYRSAGKSSKSG